MLLSLVRFLSGYLRIRVIGYSPERFLNLCRHHGIYLWGLKPDSRNYEMFISVRNFRKLKPVIKKTKTKVVIINRYGLPFFYINTAGGKYFFAGAFGCAAFILLMSSFVWNIHIEGNYTETDETLLEFLETKKVRHGMRKSEIDCPRIVKDIRGQFDDIIWVSVSVEGTRLLIRVKENTDTLPYRERDTDTVCDLVASEDGEIVSMITRSGVPQVSVGDQVKKGDLLVSGRVELKNDAGEVTEYCYESADADILLRVTENYYHEIPVFFDRKCYTDKRKTQIYVRIKRTQWMFGSAANHYEHAETVTAEERLKLGEHFYFPVTYGKRTVREYRLKREKRSDRALQEILSAEFRTFCRNLEKKGVAIIEKDVKIYKGKQNAAADGTLVLVKPAYEKKAAEIIRAEQKETKTEGND